MIVKGQEVNAMGKYILDYLINRINIIDFKTAVN